jgi:prepilin-type N-terminal cleavage/methylation domain-containing protein
VQNNRNLNLYELKEKIMKEHQQGFSLIELAIVLAISAVMFGITITSLNSQYEISAYKVTQTKLDLVKKAMANYLFKFGRLPCPADPTAAQGSAVYANEVASCFSNVAACSTGINCGTNVVTGAVPTATLGLGLMGGIDAWDDKIIYAIDPRFTQANSSKCQVQGKLLIGDDNGNLLNANGTATYVLVSAGKNKAGAYNDQGVLNVACKTTLKEGENCNADATFIDGSFDDAAGVTGYYDDVISWDINHNMQQCPAGVVGCNIWFDAADPCSVTYNSSNVVSAWQDKSSSNFSAASGAASPTYVSATSNLTNGNQYLLFSSGSNTLMSVSNLSATTAFPITDFTEVVVFLPTSVRAAAIINAADSAAYNTTNADRLIGTSATGMSIYKMAGGTISDVTVASLAAPTIATATISSSVGQKLFVNGAQVATSATTTSTFVSPSNFNIGGNASVAAFDGRILEIVTYPRVLSDLERQQLESYLATKWGVVY